MCGPHKYWVVWTVKSHSHIVPMDILPNNVFLEIFNLCLRDPTTSSLTQRQTQRASNWQTQVHICQRWWRVIFLSPRQLNLHLHCSNRTPVLKNLAFWPVTLPLTLNYSLSRNHVSWDEDNIATAILHSTCIQHISIFGKDPLIKKSGHHHAEVVSCVDTSWPWAESWSLDLSGYFQETPGWICPMSTTSLL